MNERNLEKLQHCAGEWGQTEGQSNTGVVNDLHWPSQGPDVNLNPIENMWHRTVILPSNSLKWLNTQTSSIFQFVLFFLFVKIF